MLGRFAVHARRAEGAAFAPSVIDPSRSLRTALVLVPPSVRPVRLPAGLRPVQPSHSTAQDRSLLACGPACRVPVAHVCRRRQSLEDASGLKDDAALPRVRGRPPRRAGE